MDPIRALRQYETNIGLDLLSERAAYVQMLTELGYSPAERTAIARMRRSNA